MGGEKASQEYEAAVFLAGLNQEQYQGILDELANSYLSRRDKYPKSLVAAHNLVSNWKGTSKVKRPNKTNNGVSFHQQYDDSNKITNATEGILRRSDGKPVKCNICGGNHYPRECNQNITPRNNSGNVSRTPKSSDKNNDDNKLAVEGDTQVKTGNVVDD